MIGRKLGFQLADFAKAHNMGIGNFRLKDGSSVKILSNDRGSYVMQVKNGRLLSAEYGRGEGLGSILDRYASKAEDIKEMDKEYMSSFDVEI